MKRSQKPSSLLLAVKFFFESFFEGIRHVFKKLLTLTGMFFALASVFGASQIYEHLFRAAPMAASDEATSLTDESKNALNLTSNSDASRGPASADSAIGKSGDSGQELSPSSHNNDSGPAMSESTDSKFNRQSQNSPLNGAGRTGSFSRLPDSSTSASQSKNPGSKKDSADTDRNAGGIPLVGNLPSPTPTLQGSAGSNSNNPNQIGSSVANSAQASAITSGGGISKAAQLMVQSQIGEVLSPLIQKGSQLQIINGLTGTQN